MTEHLLHMIVPEEDLPGLQERILRLPEWRRRRTLSCLRDIDRLQSALAYELLERLFRLCFGLDLRGISIIYDPLGHPSIPEHPGIWFSLSHCQETVMAAVSDAGPVGCDIESVPDSYPADVVDLYYSDAEKRLIAAATDKPLEFTRIWTMKEGAFKLDNSLDIERLDTASLTHMTLLTERHGRCVTTLATLRE